MRFLLIIIAAIVLTSCMNNPFDLCQDIFSITPYKDDQKKIEAFFPTNYRVEYEEAGTEALNQSLVGSPSVDDFSTSIRISVIEGLAPNDDYSEIGENLTFNKEVIAYKNKADLLLATFQKTHPDKNYFIDIQIKIECTNGQNPNTLGLCQFESVVRNTKFLF